MVGKQGKNEGKQNKKLGKQEKIFCDAYISNGFNGTQAAITAKYAESSARNQAYKMLKRPHIKEYIEDYMRGVQEEFKNKKIKALETQWDLAMQASGQKDTTIIKSASFQGYVTIKEYTGRIVDHGAAATHFSNIAKMMGWNEENVDNVASVNVFLGTRNKDNAEKREKRVEDHLKSEGVLK